MCKNKRCLQVVFFLLVLSFSFANPVHAQLTGKSMQFEDASPETDNDSGTNNKHIHDPYENWNRKVFAFNDKVYRYVFNPVTKGYNLVIPKFVQKRINNVFTNIAAPRDFVNAVFQNKFKDSGRTLSRFLINSTLGIGGIFNPASHMFDSKLQHEDFGQTLGSYGMEEGAYLVLPFLGPSTKRDMVGYVVDLAFDPLVWLTAFGVEPQSAVIGVAAERSVNDYAYNIHDGYEDFMKNSIEPYISMRDIYIKYRRNELKK